MQNMINMFTPFTHRGELLQIDLVLWYSHPFGNTTGPKAVVFPPVSRIKDPKSKGAAAGAGCCGNITGSCPIIGGCIGLLSISSGFSGRIDGSSSSLEISNPDNESINITICII